MKEGDDFIWFWIGNQDKYDRLFRLSSAWRTNPCRTATCQSNEPDDRADRTLTLFAGSWEAGTLE